MPGNDSFERNVVFAVSSNLAVALVSALTTVIVPKFIGVEEYGYWQLFVFYGSYALLIQVGISDGSNLRYAGLRKSDLPSRGVGLQGLILFSVTTILATGVIFFAPYVLDLDARTLVIQMTAVYAAIVNVRHFVLMQMQSTADFRTYSRITIADRLLFTVLVAFLLLGETDYWLLAGAEIVSKAVTLIIAFSASRRVFFAKEINYRNALAELLSNIYTGIKLTIANTANMLILGVSRFLIDRVFGVAVFGAVSLVLNLSSFFMIFVSAVGLVLLPTLRRSRLDRLPVLYETARLPLSTIPLTLLVVAYPLMELVILWLPEYKIGLQYLVLLMPMIAFESRMGLLVNPFLKTLRKENALLVINLIALGLSTALSILSASVLENLDLAILSILISLGLRALMAEIFLLRVLKLRLPVSSIAETAIIVLSVTLQLTVGGAIASVLLAFLVVGYLVAFRKNFIRSFRLVYQRFRSR